MLLSDNLYKGITNSILLNSYNTNKCGLLGKAGYSLCLFEILRHLDDKMLEDLAFELLQKSLALSTNNNDIGFEDGLSGIGFTILYLIENQFIDADFYELFGEQYDKIQSKAKEIAIFSEKHCL